MDFSLPPEIEELRRRVRAFVEERLIPLEADRANYDEHENIARPCWSGCAPRRRPRGSGRCRCRRSAAAAACPMVGMAACYEEMNRSIFGPVVFNGAAPDDGNMMRAEQGGDRGAEGALAAADHRRQGAVRLRHDRARWLRQRSRRMTYTRAERVGNDRWLITRPQVVHHRRRRGEALHPDGAHLGRRPQGPDRLPVPRRPARAGRSSAASRSWGRRSMAGIASWSSTGWRSPTRTC